MRRIVQYPPTVQYSDLNISPQWHQWLRHTRPDPPSITEQSQDLVRQKNLKVLAAAADARWAAKPSFLDAPRKPELGQPLPATEVGGGGAIEPPAKEGVKNNVGRFVDDNVSGDNQTAINDHKREEPEKKAVAGKSHPSNRDGALTETRQKEDPWKQARGGPSEEWQPAAWDGNIQPAKR
jgi:NADH dehydrogenase [ubiquinone] 1 alpha subcomplex assembly factor 2